MNFLRRPQQVFWRKVMFQIHLWAGIILCLSTIVIGVSGSILVFETESGYLTFPKLWKASPSSSHVIGFPEATATIAPEFPDYQIVAGYPPDQPGHNFEFQLRRGQQARDVFFDAGTGRIAGEINPARSWIAWIIDLHFRLLGGSTGEKLNGIGAVCLMLLCLTAIVVWWLDLKYWTRHQDQFPRSLEAHELQPAHRCRLLDTAHPLHVGLHRRLPRLERSL